jgi:hypothetical protein
VTPVQTPPAPAANPPADAAGAPATQTPAQPTQTVTVPQQPSDPETTGGTASSLPLLGKHRRHRGNNLANTDKGGSTASQTGPVTTGVEPSSTCDADADGVTDPGAPTTCTVPGTTTTTGGDQTTTTQPPPATVYSVQPKKQRSRSRVKSKSKSKSRSKSRSKTRKSAPKKRSKQPKAGV